METMVEQGGGVVHGGMDQRGGMDHWGRVVAGGLVDDRVETEK